MLGAQPEIQTARADALTGEFPQPQPEPSASATLKIVVEPLGIEVHCTVPEQHSVELVQIAGIAMATLGPALLLWVGASTGYPPWIIIVLAVAVMGVATKIHDRRDLRCRRQ